MKRRRGLFIAGAALLVLALVAVFALRPKNEAIEAKLETAGYYDTVNFAKRVKVPGIYSWGYNDETCMPTTTYSAYNSVTAPKTLSLQLATGHNIVTAQNDRINAWIQEIFKTGKAPAPKEESFADR